MVIKDKIKGKRSRAKHELSSFKNEFRKHLTTFITGAFAKKRLKDYEISAILSGVLYHLKTDTRFHGAYTTKEILDACDALGYHPSDVAIT